MRKLVLNIPHSSVNGIFDPRIGRWPREAGFINEAVRKYTDWFTDFLFATERDNVVPVIFDYSRFVCDAERLDDDPLKSSGQGIIYTEYLGYKRGALPEDARAFLLGLRRRHLGKLSEELSEDGSILIDCHSFTNRDGVTPDICIGFNNDSSYDVEVVSIVKNIFRDSGYSVALNFPYSNSLVPAPLEKISYKSIMIEVNKRIYMDREALLLKDDSKHLTRWFGCMEKIYEKLSCLTSRTYEM